MTWFPVVGVLIGAAVGGVAAGLWQVVPPLVAAAVAVVIGLLITGAFHEDGLADVADDAGGVAEARPGGALEVGHWGGAPGFGAQAAAREHREPGNAQHLGRLFVPQRPGPRDEGFHELRAVQVGGYAGEGVEPGRLGGDRRPGRLARLQDLESPVEGLIVDLQPLRALDARTAADTYQVQEGRRLGAAGPAAVEEVGYDVPRLLLGQSAFGELSQLLGCRMGLHRGLLSHLPMRA